MKMRYSLPLPFVLAVLSGCSSADDAETAAPAPATPTAAVAMPAAEASESAVPFAEGAWMINNDKERRAAQFGPEFGQYRVVIACPHDGSGAMLTLAGDYPDGGAYKLQSGGEAAQLDMVPFNPGQTMAARIDLKAPVFANLLVDGGDLTITAPDGASLRLPGSPSIARVFEECS